MEIILDTLCLTEPETAHAYLKEKFAFPEYYGNNLDALFECLTDICEETVLHLHTQSGQTPDSPYFSKLLGVMRDAEAENPRLTIMTDGEEEEDAEALHEDAFEDNAEDDDAVVSSEE